MFHSKRSRRRGGRLGLLLVGSLASFAIASAGSAGTFGTGGVIDEVDVAAGTIEVNGYVIYVTSTSRMVDHKGQRVRLEDLDRYDVEVGVSMVKAGSRYLLRELYFVGDDVEE